MVHMYLYYTFPFLNKGEGKKEREGDTSFKIRKVLGINFLLKVFCPCVTLTMKSYDGFAL